jgi:hypothetical protein
MGGRIARSGNGCAGLAEPVGASRHAGLDTPPLEPVTKFLHRERPLVGGFQECQITQHRASQDRFELWQDRDYQIDRLRAAVLVLAKGDPAAVMDFSHQAKKTGRSRSALKNASKKVGNSRKWVNRQGVRPLAV